MDSITQIVLGAAAGDAVLGKRIGNRAMVWGAIAGTIPDLDIIGNLWMSELDSLAFHRGISHSFLFSIVGAFLFGWLIHRMYESRFHKLIGMAGWILISLATASLFLLVGKFSIIKAAIGISIGVGGSYLTFKRFNRPAFAKPEASLRDWQWLFFWSLITHPILDTFTAYGTQLFAPFSNYRAAISNISVADPAYTLLFVIPLIIAAFYHRSKPIRKKLVWTGIILSSIYMCFTLYNKYRVTQVMKDTLVAENIEYSRFFTSPSILNNILWTGVVDSKGVYYFGQYSLLDIEPKFKLSKMEKNHDLIADASQDDKVINILRWFSNDYFAVMKREDGKLQINDMRYGIFKGDGTSEKDFIFNFPVERLSDGSYNLIKAQGGPPDGADRGEMATDLWARIKGI